MTSDYKNMDLKSVVHKFYLNAGCIPDDVLFAMMMDSELKSIESKITVNLLRKDHPRSKPPLVGPVAGCQAHLFTEGSPLPAGGKFFDRRARELLKTMMQLLNIDVTSADNLQSVFTLLRHRLWSRIRRDYCTHDDEGIQ